MIYLRTTWIAVLGVVYGDIGTSPLYALKGCPTHDVVGLISVFIWTIFLAVTLKYVFLILRLDNDGEGGILALVALRKWFSWGILGVALFLGDSILTPAISVVGALEGLDVAVTSVDIKNFIPILAAAFILLLFAIQRLGTQSVGQLFGPVMIIWFSAMAFTGLPSIIKNPKILVAFNPLHALEFLWHAKTPVWSVMGHALLAVTGAEALYADLGHFTRHDIQRVWVRFVWPALMINYLGQGALLIGKDVIVNPFYELAPAWGVMPLVVIATLASLVASQAIISGVFSLAWQGIMLGYFPNMRIVRPSNEHANQIYVPAMNTFMCVGTLFAIALFRSSENLALAYGLSVSSLMLMTTLLAICTKRNIFWWLALIPVGLLEVSLVSSSVIKFWHGAWYAFLVTFAVGYVIFIWRKGCKFIESVTPKQYFGNFLKSTEHKSRFSGTGVYVRTAKVDLDENIPLALAFYEKSQLLLPQNIICVDIIRETTKPKVKASQRYFGIVWADGLYQIQAHYGFKESPDLNRILSWAKEQSFFSNEDSEDFFYWGRMMAVVSDRNKLLQGVGERVYVVLDRLQTPPNEFVRMPYAKTLELTSYVPI